MFLRILFTRSVKRILWASEFEKQEILSARQALKASDRILTKLFNSVQLGSPNTCVMRLFFFFFSFFKL